MDNITHTLIGATVGHSLSRLPSEKRLKRAVFWTSVIGNNVPDLDVLVRLFSENPKLGYLLHHRGLTHTFLFTPVTGALLAIGTAIYLRQAITWPPRLHGAKTFGLIFLVGTLSAALHILADFCNEFGVHPFSPMSNQWYYGDFIFIVEPLIWLVLLPYLAFKTQQNLVRAVFGLLGGFIVTASLFIISWKSFITLSLFGMLLLWLHRHLKKDRWVYCFLLGVYAVFAATSHIARAKLARALKIQRPNEKIIQLALSPVPANPFCWRQVIVTIDPGDQGVQSKHPGILITSYMVRLGVSSLWPAFFPISECKGRLGNEPTLSLAQNDLKDTEGVYWFGVFQRPVSEFKSLLGEYCQFQSFIEFSRAPFWILNSNQKLIVGDMRYDRHKGLGFAELSLNQQSSCTDSRLWDWPVRAVFEGMD